MTQALAHPDPIIRFDASQQKFFRDDARVIVVNWHRQKGKDFVAAAKAVDHAMRTGQHWYIVSLTQRQADATFAKCKQHAKLVREAWRKRGLPVPAGAAGEDTFEEYGSEQYDKWLRQAFHFTAHKIVFPSGGSVTSLPGRDPDTLAGLTGNIIFTEFGLFPGGGYDHWGVIFPIVTRNGARMIVISTPRGRNTKFYELTQNADGFYSTHTCDIYKSVHEDGFQLFDAKGNPFPQTTREERDLAIATFRRIYNDESKWPREYECQFTGDLSSLITWAELERAAAAGADLPFDFIRIDGDPADSEANVAAMLLALKSDITGGARVETGWDVARTGHISSALFNIARAGKPKHLRFNALMHGSSFEAMRSVVRAVMDLQRFSVGRGDRTGLGMESNEVLERLYRDRWEGFNFTATGKREIASALKTAFADGTQTLPPMSGATKYVATDIYAVQKDDTGAALTLEETENPLLPESHCDVAYSLGLSRVAGASAPVRFVSPPLAHVPVEYGL